MCGGNFVDIPLDGAKGYQLDIEAVKKAITDKTKMVIINNPCNPTGAVFDYDSLKELCELAVEHNFLILSDEIYSRLVYDGATFYSLPSRE